MKLANISYILADWPFFGVRGTCISFLFQVYLFYSSLQEMTQSFLLSLCLFEPKKEKF